MVLDPFKFRDPYVVTYKECLKDGSVFLCFYRFYIRYNHQGVIPYRSNPSTECSSFFCSPTPSQVPYSWGPYSPSSGLTRERTVPGPSTTPHSFPRWPESVPAYESGPVTSYPSCRPSRRPLVGPTDEVWRGGPLVGLFTGSREGEKRRWHFESQGGLKEGNHRPKRRVRLDQRRYKQEDVQVTSDGKIGVLKTLYNYIRWKYQNKNKEKVLIGKIRRSGVSTDRCDGIELCHDTYEWLFCYVRNIQNKYSDLVCSYNQTPKKG